LRYILNESSLASELPITTFSVFDSLTLFPFNLLHVQSRQAELIVVKHLIQGHANATRLGVVKPRIRDRDHVRRKNGALTPSATWPIEEWKE